MNMSKYSLDVLPPYVLLEIFGRCHARDLAALSMTCANFNDILSTDVIWKKICQRELGQTMVDLGKVESYRKLYSNLLHKYKSILGIYQTVCGHFGNLLEIKYDAGNITGIRIEGTSEPGKIFHDMVEEIQFVIKGEVEPPKLVCLPTMDPHGFNLKVDQATGKLSYKCSLPRKHMKMLFKKLDHDVQSLNLSNFTRMGARKLRLDYLQKHMVKNSKRLISLPLTLPSPENVPRSLRKEDGSIPCQLITPGFFKGDYSTHGVELLLFKYVSENELHGFKVTGDPNIPAGKISIKCFLDYSVNPTPEEQSSIEALAAIPKERATVAVHEIPKQKFKLPEDLYEDPDSSYIHAPPLCLARYHGECQVAGTNYKCPSFTEAHIINFNDNLIGVMVMDLRHVFFFSRCERPFAPPYCGDVKGIF